MTVNAHKSVTFLFAGQSLSPLSCPASWKCERVADTNGFLIGFHVISALQKILVFIADVIAAKDLNI